MPGSCGCCGLVGGGVLVDPVGDGDGAGGCLAVTLLLKLALGVEVVLVAGVAADGVTVTVMPPSEELEKLTDPRSHRCQHSD